VSPEVKSTNLIKESSFTCCIKDEGVFEKRWTFAIAVQADVAT
jgi:hypothetical protein